MRDGLLCQIRQPLAGNAVIPGVPWIADNGCYTTRRWSFLRWGRWLRSQPRTAEWAVVPDVVGDHAATLRRWHRFAPWVRRLGFRPAFVAQDGCTPDAIPHDAEVVFIGGTTPWKLSRSAHAVVLEAQRRGLTTHMGRVNSLRRIRVAAMWGCDSADGTYLAKAPDTNLPKLLAWLYPPAPSFWGVA